MLNSSKGSAVRGPRVQADRKLYQNAVRRLVLDAGVQLIEGEAVALLVSAGSVIGTQLADSSQLLARAVVLTTGTFLDAVMFRGEERWKGGRLGGQASSRMAAQVRELGLAQGRLKTGTPPRLDARTIDWGRVVPQPSDRSPWTMALASQPVPRPQLSCAITRTNPRSHDVIRGGLGRSPLFAGAIEGRGPRYCPSIEDKIHRFGDRDGHQIFLEPEGLDTHLVYPNGISTSLPTDVQIELVRSIEGLERTEIVQPGYAVEYEHADPRRLEPTLQHREVGGLFFAGQINGTTGYEEAAAQGLVAGLNAAAKAKDLAEARFDRETSYIGVMVDDLTLQGVSEPYRMLTARSEYRLYLRADNAVSRLGPMALELGALEAEQADRVRSHLSAKQHADSLLVASATGQELGISDTSRKSLAAWARREDLLPAIRDRLPTGAAVEEAIDDSIYEPYIARLRGELEARKRDKALSIPLSFAFETVPGLSNEMRERLQLAGPANLDQASRVPGITPAAMSALHFALARAAA
jgi:tRNA uridine 5-carboxymethylaminomethyl modification enzyme